MAARIDRLGDHPLAETLGDFEDYLDSEGRAVRTVKLYRDAVAYLAESELVPDGITRWDQVTRAHVRAHQASLLKLHSRAYANNQHRAIRQFFRFLASEYGLPDVMEGMKPPTVPPQLVPVISPAEQRAMLGTCAGGSFDDVRNTAVLKMFISSGARLSEVSQLTADGIDLEHHTAVVIGKASKPRVIVFDDATAKALRRYLRLRRKHRHSGEAGLWVGQHGVLTSSGVAQIVTKAGNKVGLKVHAHQFRHSFASTWLANGGQEGDLMRLAGWQNANMIHQRYGASLADQRAQAAYGRVMGGRRRA